MDLHVQSNPRLTGRLTLTTPTAHNARHQHVHEFSMSLSECAQSSSVCSPKRGGFPHEFDDGDGLKNRCRSEEEAGSGKS
jgi:hypothetical protein